MHSLAACVVPTPVEIPDNVVEELPDLDVPTVITEVTAALTKAVIFVFIFIVVVVFCREKMGEMRPIINPTAAKINSTPTTQVSFE